jgi:hypothetical protein
VRGRSVRQPSANYATGGSDAQQPERQNPLTCLSRYNRSEGVKPMPILLWLLGVPLSVVVILWLVHVI